MTTHTIQTLSDQQVIENFLFISEGNDKTIRADELTDDKVPTIGRGVNLFVETNSKRFMGILQRHNKFDKNYTFPEGQA